MGIYIGASNRTSAFTIFLKKNILRVKTSTPYDSIYAELGRQTLYTFRLVHIINYWFKISTSLDAKYMAVRILMLQDVEAYPNKVWEHVVKVGFYEDWLQQGVGNFNVLVHYSSKVLQTIMSIT